MASPSTLTRVVSVAASLRYDDGKTLKGIGTLASKSRLTGLKESFLECLPNRSETIRKEDKKRLLLREGVEERVEGEGDELPATRFYLSLVYFCMNMEYGVWSNMEEIKFGLKASSEGRVGLDRLMGSGVWPCEG